MVKSSKLLAVIITAFFLTTEISCSSNDDDNDPNAECQNAICTLEFVTILVSVVDQNQNPVALDSFTVENAVNGGDMTVPLTPSQLVEAQEGGRYPLITDGILEVNQERQLQFRGFVNNQEVISGDFTVGTDCCHVSLVSGDLQLSL